MAPALSALRALHARARRHVTARGSLMEIEYPPGSGNKIKIPGMPWRDVAAAGPARNPPALAFWPRVAAKVVGDNVETLEGDGKMWTGPILRFVSPA